MPLGIDLGTTRTVVAYSDHGNYPVVSFDAGDSASLDHWPATIAWQGDQLRFGLDADKAKRSGWSWLPSLKPLLGSMRPQQAVVLGTNTLPLLSLLTDYLRALHQDLEQRSNLPPGESLASTWVAVPANADSNQRYLTLEGFRRAGFNTLGMLNEPAAAGVEYVRHHHPAGSKKRYLGVYDLGGGTFDAAAIQIDDRDFEVRGNHGLAQLGGNDFDAVLADLAIKKAESSTRADVELDPEQRLALIDECRERKEGLGPNTRRIMIDLGVALPDADEVIIDVRDFYQRCTPLIEQTLDATEAALADLDSNTNKNLAAIYLVGGSCALPLVARLLRERYGRRVRKSAHPHAATAIGLAIAADGAVTQRIHERFTRNFGVWRECKQGEGISFDPIFTRDTALPIPGQPPLLESRRYSPAHNVGHFRYLECAGLGSDGRPAGDLRPWDEIRFPIDPQLASCEDLGEVAVSAWPEAAEQMIEEEYACDAYGTIEVTIRNRSAGYQRCFQLRSDDNSPSDTDPAEQQAR